MMKRTLAAVLSAVLMLSLSACALPKLPGRNTANGKDRPEPEVQSEAAPAQEAEVVMAVPETPEPTPVPTPTPEPYADKPDLDINSWEFKLANSFNSIGEYEPPYSAIEGQGINEHMLEPAMEFLQAARAAGFNAYYSTVYRNYEFQENRFKSFLYNVAEDAVDAANRMLAPGLNEHQTGLAVDFIDNAIYSAYYDSFDDSYMKDTELYAWLKEHCAEYGFILRYPEGKEQFYGVACEHPAHFRYVGKEAAKYITEHDLCLEEFIMLYDADKIYVPQP